VEFGQDRVVKRRAHAPEGFFPAEAAGLRWLAVPGGTRVVRVLEVSASHIALERIPDSAASRRAAAAFGESLARTHDAGAAGFGARPEGYAGPCYIGDTGLPMPDAAAVAKLGWGEFYADYRVLPYVAMARADGAFSASGSRVFEQLAQRLRAGDFDDGAPAARIHGDLWAGNVLFTGDEAVLIDPAAHGGHRIADLAMLSFTGFPHLETVWDAYEASSACLPEDWRALVALHLVHPLLVHTVLFGSGWAGAALRAAERYVG
jgi:fructosamine-3-kinase